MSTTVLQSMVDDILTDRSTDAMVKFNQLMADRMQIAIDDKKIEVAKTIYATDNQEDENIQDTQS